MRSREALIFAGDPTDPNARPARFAYLPERRYDTSDATALPNGDLLVLDRRFRLPYHFSATISRVRGGMPPVVRKAASGLKTGATAFHASGETPLGRGKPLVT